MPMPSDAEAYYAAHTQALREYGAMNAARLWPRQALQYTTVNGARFLPSRPGCPSGPWPLPSAPPSRSTWCTSTTYPPATAPHCGPSPTST
ncbi:hypothetical protein [Streptomyces virginiae]|uniref:Uncharacterized protein n=1 Tax=Streptomyces virginiae TaxID=1961 RepID=A0ABZ1T6L1_STRVG|nr:hypothetical protein [Streptomyces virginiae]